MRCYVLDEATASYRLSADGSKVWNLSHAEALRASETAVIVSVETAFGGSLNVYREGRFIGQVECGTEWVLR